VSGSDDGAVDQDVVDAEARRLLERYQRKIMEVEERVEGLGVRKGGSERRSGRRRSSRLADGVASEGQKDVLRRRWRQVGEIVKEVLGELGG
jgi:hypothetical protein